MFTNKVAVVTGGAKGIGRAIVQEFRKAGAAVCVIDLLPNEYFVGDVSDKAAVAFQKEREKFSKRMRKACCNFATKIQKRKGRLQWVKKPL